MGRRGCGVAHPVNTLLPAEAIAAMMRAANSRLLVVPGPQLGVDLWEKAVAAAQATPSLAAVVVLGDSDPGSGYRRHSDLPRGPSRRPTNGADLSSIRFCFAGGALLPRVV